MRLVPPRQRSGALTLAAALFLGGAGCAATPPRPAATAHDAPTCLERTALPAPSGQGAVGVATYHWTADRPEERTPAPDDRRQLSASVRYPAAAPPGAEPAPYLPELDAFLAGIGSLPGPAPRGLADYAEAFACVDAHSVADAPVAGRGEAFPVVVLSPGGNVSRHWHTALAEDLASRGYVVAVLSHPHNGLDVFPGRGLVTSSAYWDESVPRILEEQTDRYADEIALGLDRVLALGRAGRLAGRLDTARVAVVGYSRGGRAAPRVCRRDPRVQACVAYEALGPEAERASGTDRPMLVVRVPWQPERTAALRDALRRNGAPAYEVVVDGGSHFSFTDLPVIVPERFGTEADPREVLRHIGDVTASFLDGALRGRPTPVLDGSVPAPDGLAVHTYGRPPPRSP